ncbi:MAG: hypothetical protein AB9856_10740 [Cellulosilyticaceae bacterium]
MSLKRNSMMIVMCALLLTNGTTVFGQEKDYTQPSDVELQQKQPRIRGNFSRHCSMGSWYEIVSDMNVLNETVKVDVIGLGGNVDRVKCKVCIPGEDDQIFDMLDEGSDFEFNVVRLKGYSISAYTYGGSGVVSLFVRDN